jgi:hypothetical protein
MHTLIGICLGLAVAAAFIILWASGNLFACVFLSIPPALGLLVIAMRDNPAMPIYPLICIGALVVIWTPRYLHRRVRNHHPQRRDALIPMPEARYVPPSLHVPKSLRLALPDRTAGQ